MHAELKAYIHAVTDGECSKRTASSAVREFSRTALAFVTDLLQAAGPYYCELRPMKRVRGAIAKCCPKQAIGFHGLA